MKELWLRIRALFDQKVDHNLNTWEILAVTDGSVPVPQEHFDGKQVTYEQVFVFLENFYGMRRIVGMSFIHNREILNAKECFEFSELTNAFMEGVPVFHLNNIIVKRNRMANIPKFSYTGLTFEGWSKRHD